MPKLLTSRRSEIDLENIAATIEDVAHSLSHICRFNGHTPFHFSVAQHSLLVADLVSETDPNLAVIALLHDAHEAYFGDITSPMKSLFSQWTPVVVSIEDEMQRQTMASLLGVAEGSLPPFLPEVINAADALATCMERRALFRESPSEVNLSESSDLNEFLKNWPTLTARRLFLKSFEEMRSRDWLKAWTDSLS